mmetsp:Transcript_8234/g.10682  ORF Transcript_8234/g.10682 Transcript_8234/m.10682 type:complete len:146 (+) Transcript_8234:49-486(+)
MEQAQAAQAKLQEAFAAVDEDLKQRRFKPLQKAAYLCMAKCCDSNDGQQALQTCFEQCNQPVQKASQLYQGETQRFQQKVQRCAAACQDNAQDLMTGMSAEQQQDPAQMAKMESVFGTCVSKCATDHVAAIKGFSKNLDSALKSI